MFWMGKVKFVFVGAFTVAILSGCLSFPGYKIPRDQLELMPRDAAAEFLNTTQRANDCSWGEYSVYNNRARTTRRYDEARMTYTITKNEKHSVYFIYVTVNVRGQFLNEICNIADHNPNIGHHHLVFYSESIVRDVAAALESLGVVPVWLNK